MRRVKSTLCRTCLLAALCLLTLGGCAASLSDEPQPSLAVADDPASYDGVWMAHVVPVAGDNCAQVLELALTSSAGRITGWLAVRAAIGTASLSNLPVEGKLSERGRWDVLVSDENGESFATASGWFREDGSLGQMEASDAACFWRLHLRRASPARRSGTERPPR